MCGSQSSLWGTSRGQARACRCPGSHPALSFCCAKPGPVHMMGSSEGWGGGPQLALNVAPGEVNLTEPWGSCSRITLLTTSCHVDPGFQHWVGVPVPQFTVLLFPRCDGASS